MSGTGNEDFSFPVFDISDWEKDERKYKKTQNLLSTFKELQGDYNTQNGDAASVNVANTLLGNAARTNRPLEASLSSNGRDQYISTDGYDAIRRVTPIMDVEGDGDIKGWEVKIIESKPRKNAEHHRLQVMHDISQQEVAAHNAGYIEDIY